MGKLKEKNKDKISSLPRELSDEEFNQWIHERFLEEAADIESELNRIPDSEDWKPTDEKFQALMSKAREQGFFEENNSADSREIDDREAITKEKTLKEENVKTEKLNMEEKAENRNCRREGGYWRRRVVKYAAYAAVTVFGIFGVSMSSEANRTYVMQEVNKLIGNDVSTKVNNSEVMQSNRTEVEAIKSIEDAFDIKMPQLFYMPDGMEYMDCSIDTEAQMAIMQYSYNEQLVFWTVFANDKEISRFSKADNGIKQEEIKSDMTLNLTSKIWEIKEEGDEKETYTLQWEYRNVYHKIVGKIGAEEIEKIAKKIMY
nr:DUF4367 domain-containing protein [uncultured Blautia sp.]